MVFTLTLTGANPCTPSAPPTLQGGFWLDAVISNIVSDDQVHLFGDNTASSDACLSVLAQTTSGFVFVEDLNTKDSGDDAARFLFSPGNGFIITDNLQTIGGVDPGTLCGVKGNVITLLAAADGSGGLTFQDSQGTPVSGTCTSTQSVASCTSSVAGLGELVATMTSVQHCAASGNPGYCNS